MEDLRGKKILVTAGPTRADIDAVRFISNRSSGRLGASIVSAALERGARVTLVAGPGSAEVNPGGAADRLRLLSVETVRELIQTLEQLLGGRAQERYDAIAHAMAVLDYEPAEPSPQKTKSGLNCWSLPLKKTPKVITHLKRWTPASLLVGFKLESGVSESDLIAAARRLMEQSGADLVVANDLKLIKDGCHPALIIDRDGQVAARAQTKAEIAEQLCNFIAKTPTA